MKKELSSFYVKKNTLMKIVYERLFKSLPKQNLPELREDWMDFSKFYPNLAIPAKKAIVRLMLEKARLGESQRRRRSKEREK
jgi:hypothetical protein